ncbi:hypothetical protein EJ110_NYTH49039 [Nymphaea thermarum]|nr:hypothetical protein EJ110_NYTH49039 [Nymphaea thermarum]
MGHKTPYPNGGVRFKSRIVEPAVSPLITSYKDKISPATSVHSSPLLYLAFFFFSALTSYLGNTDETSMVSMIFQLTSVLLLIHVWKHPKTILRGASAVLIMKIITSVGCISLFFVMVTALPFVLALSLPWNVLYRGSSFSVGRGLLWMSLFRRNLTFKAGFYQLGENAFSFAIWFAEMLDQQATVVSMANRDCSVNSRGLSALKAHNCLSLLDSSKRAEGHLNDILAAHVRKRYFSLRVGIGPGRAGPIRIGPIRPVGPHSPARPGPARPGPASRLPSPSPGRPAAWPFSSRLPSPPLAPFLPTRPLPSPSPGPFPLLHRFWLIHHRRHLRKEGGGAERERGKGRRGSRERMREG